MVRISLRVVVLLVVAIAGCGGSGSQGGAGPIAGAPVNGRIIVSELLGAPCGLFSQIISYASDGTDPVFLITSRSNIVPTGPPVIHASSCHTHDFAVGAIEANELDPRTR